MKRARVVAAIASLALASCGAEPTTTTETSSPETTTSSGAGTTTTLSPFDRATPIVTDDLVAELEDGTYISLIDHVFTEGMTGGPEIHFDLAVWFGGDEANHYAEIDGEESPRPNDYYIRNLDPTVLVLPVDPEVRVTSVWYHYEETQDLTGGPITYEELVEALTGEVEESRLAMRFSPWWVTIEDGQVVAIEEQYVP
jgi:hypothetical protein